MSTMSEKRAVRKAEKRIEREEAEAGFKLNKIKPVTNGLFNVLFILLSFICIFQMGMAERIPLIFTE